MKRRQTLFLTVCALLLIGPSSVQAQMAQTMPFVTGADLSELPFYESAGVKYADGGREETPLAIAKQNNWKIIRVRLWVNPGTDPKARVSDLAHVTALGKRIKAAGFEFLLDFHYSDTWADPGHQVKPAAWADLPFPQLVRKVHDYSRDVIVHLSQNGARPDLVQIGNETRNGLLTGDAVHPGGGFWEADKAGMGRAAQLLAAGLAGVHDADPKHPPLTMIHVPDGQDLGFVKWYFPALADAARTAHPPVALHYDMIGLSYYPGIPWDHKAGYEPWHLSHLTASMNFVATALHKPVMVVETSWPQASSTTDVMGTPEFSFTPAGQSAFYTTLIHAVRAVPNGLGRGVILWEPDLLNWDSVFDAHGNALPAVRILGSQ